LQQVKRHHWESSEWGQNLFSGVQKQGATDKNCNTKFYTNMEKELLYCEGDRALEQAAWRGWRYSRPTWMLSCAGEPPLAGGLD